MSLVSARNVKRIAPLNGTHRLRTLAVTGGFLDGLSLSFSNGLNCVIGARGSGKTTVLELVRFTLDALPPAMPGDDPDRRRIEALIESNLGDGRVELTVETSDGLVYSIQRSWGEEPVVLAADGKPTSIKLRAGAFFRADIYSQDQIERMAGDAMSQLALIDTFEPRKLAEVDSELRGVHNKLSANLTAMRPMEDAIAALSEQVAMLPSVEEKLKPLTAVSKTHTAAMEQAQAQRAFCERQSLAVTDAWRKLQEEDRPFEELRGRIESHSMAIFVGDLVAGPNIKEIEAARTAMLDCAAEVDEHVKHARQAIQRARGQLEEIGETLGTKHAHLEQDFQGLLTEDRALRGRAAERSRLERLRSELLAKRREHDDLVAKLKKLRTERAGLLDRLSDLRDQRFHIREGIAERINAVLAPGIRVTIQQSGQNHEYRAMVEQAISVARLKHGVVAQRIVTSLSPAELVAVVRQRDTALLSARAEINDEQSRKVVDALCDPATLSALEAVELPDLPHIALRDGGEYKESTRLSTGQKCTTILPILLMDGDYPLLIDQPEDNLDNRFVCECVVESIGKIKTNRQLVFVTHNPNIPGLGDAERVHVLQSDGARSTKVSDGDVDGCKEFIVTLLEGGEDAFFRRGERYGRK